MTSRRTFLEGALVGGIATLSGASSLASAQQTSAVETLRQAVDLGRRVRRGELSQTGWQDAVEPLLRSKTVTELSEAIDLRALRARARPVARGSSILRVPLFRRLGADEGADMKVFFFRAGRSDPPHVHFNLLAAHIVLEGRFRVRHFERVREQDDGFVLRAGRDRILGPGEVSSISDHRDNGHWHLAETDGVLLDVQQGRLDPSLPIRRREMIDPEGARPLADGSILSPRLGRNAALRRYG